MANLKPEEKACTKCKQVKPITAFRVVATGSGAGKVRTFCRECESAISNANYQKSRQLKANQPSQSPIPFDIAFTWPVIPERRFKPNRKKSNNFKPYSVRLDGVWGGKHI